MTLSGILLRLHFHLLKMSRRVRQVVLYSENPHNGKSEVGKVISQGGSSSLSWQIPTGGSITMGS